MVSYSYWFCVSGGSGQVLHQSFGCLSFWELCRESRPRPANERCDPGTGTYIHAFCNTFCTVSAAIIVITIIYLITVQTPLYCHIFVVQYKWVLLWCEAKKLLFIALLFPLSEEMFSEKVGMRSNSQKLLLVITDGKSNDLKEDLKNVILKANERDITRFAIGVNMNNEINWKEYSRLNIA